MTLFGGGGKEMYGGHFEVSEEVCMRRPSKWHPQSTSDSWPFKEGTFSGFRLRTSLFCPDVSLPFKRRNKKLHRAKTCKSCTSVEVLNLPIR